MYISPTVYHDVIQENINKKSSSSKIIYPEVFKPSTEKLFDFSD